MRFGTWLASVVLSLAALAAPSHADPTSPQSTSSLNPLPPCPTPLPGGPGVIDGLPLEADADCLAAGTPVLDGLYSAPIEDNLPEEPSGTGRPGASRVGIYTDSARNAALNGISVRLLVDDVELPYNNGIDQQAGCTRKDFNGHHLMVKWLENPNGLSVEQQFTWLEVGWWERTTGPNKRTIYAAVNVASEADYKPVEFPAYDLPDGTQVPFLLFRKNGSWIAQMFWQGTWAKLGSIDKFDRSAQRAEVVSETYTGCSRLEIHPGITRIGNANADRQPLRLKNAAWEWRKWDSTNFPSHQDGGITRTNSRRLCIDDDAVCEQIRWDNAWWNFRISP